MIGHICLDQLPYAVADCYVYKLHIDLGLISEDANMNDELDSEEDIYFGNGIIEEDEDTGLDGCFDDFEDGKGGCLDLFEVNGEMVELKYTDILYSYPEFSVMTNLSCPKCFSEVEVLKKRDAFD